MDRNFVEEQPVKNSSGNSKVYLVITILFAIAVLAAMIYFFRFYTKPEEKINAQVHKTEIFINEDLVYADNTVGGNKWVWEFGNGDKSTKQQGAYRFKESGSYVVRLTVNDHLREQFIVVVQDTIQDVVQDTMLFISGATSGLVLEEIRLEANGPGEIFEWWFGESGRVDAIGKSALYTYNKPGDYRVRLRSNQSATYAYHVIKIEDPLAESLKPIEAPGKGAAESLNDLKAQIQAIANGSDFDVHYNNILYRHLCNDEKVKVNVVMGDEKKQMDIYSYLMGLTFSKGITIDEVAVSSLKPDLDRECPTIINVKQTK